MSASCTKTYQIVIDAAPVGTYSWWKMEELGDASVPRVDSIRAIDIAQASVYANPPTVSRVAGILSFALEIALAPDAGYQGATWATSLLASLVEGASGATICGWVKMDGGTYPGDGISTATLFAFTFAGSEVDAYISAEVTNQILLNGGAGGPYSVVTFDGLDHPPPGVWTFIALVLDTTANEVRCYTATESNPTVAVFTEPLATHAATGTGRVSFACGMLEPTGTTFSGVWDELGFFAQPLTQAQIEYLINSGAGRTSPITLP